MAKRNWTYIIVHHTGAEEKDAAQVRRYHLSLGWRDVGYHFIIERNGKVVEGRNLETTGAHCNTGGMNSRGIGVAVLGNLENHPPLPPQSSSLLELLRKLTESLGIPPANVLGHREVPGSATVCPGRFLEMEKLRSLLLQARKVYRVQAGAFTLKENAERLAGQLRRAGFDAAVIEAELKKIRS
jgi:N-acetylmuramoyl-L-alanine amidase